MLGEWRRKVQQAWCKTYARTMQQYDATARTSMQAQLYEGRTMTVPYMLLKDTTFWSAGHVDM
jgi:hypothetical protein